MTEPSTAHDSPTLDAPLAPLERRLPPLGAPIDDDALLGEFLAYVAETGLTPYPAQEEAILEVFQGNNVILNTPTGSGKSLVALAACFKALASDQKAYYTAPIKALVSEKFFDLCRVLGAKYVGMMTGDATVNREAPVICCTAEILANIALRQGENAEAHWVVMDEFHYYSDRDRGGAWQIPILSLPQARFLLMSATLGDTKFFEEELKQRTGVNTVLVKSNDRPVPLDYEYRETAIHETISELLRTGRAPVYIVHFSQVAAAEQAQNLTSVDFLTKEQKAALKEALKGFRFDSPFGRELLRYVPHGIGVHHAGMLPKYRLLVERLAQQGHLKVICGTDTLGVGVNIPIRSVLLTQLCKYDGEKTVLLSVRDFQQIAGRAGRRGFDTRGSVVVQAPEHVIENKRAKEKAGDDPKKLRKLHMAKPPERGYVPWDAQTLERLRSSEPEKLVSRFHVGHGMLLNVLARPQGDGCRAMKRLLRDCHEPPTNKRRLRKTALSMFRSMVEAGVLTLRRGGVSIGEDLQEDFSLNQALSLYAVEAIESLDRLHPGYALALLSVVESIVESPGVILKRQVDLLKTLKLAELKAAGVEYEQRMEQLEKIDHPKPEEEFIYQTFDVFAKHHPWVAGQSIQPKSIARDMWERCASLHDYVKEYGLQRAEGVLLRYLSDVYRTLEQTVPDTAKTPEVLDLVEWLGAIVTSVDDSLIREWEKLRDPVAALARAAKEETTIARDVTADRKSFVALLRNASFRLVQALARKDWSRALAVLEEFSPPAVLRGAEDSAGARWTPERLEAELAPYFESHAELRTDPSARSPKLFLIEEEATAVWRVAQVLLDPEEDQDFTLELTVDIDGSRELGAPTLRLERMAGTAG